MSRITVAFDFELVDEKNFSVHTTVSLPYLVLWRDDSYIDKPIHENYEEVKAHFEEVLDYLFGLFSHKVYLDHVLSFSSRNDNVKWKWVEMSND